MAYAAEALALLLLAYLGWRTWRAGAGAVAHAGAGLALGVMAALAAAWLADAVCARLVANQVARVAIVLALAMGVLALVRFRWRGDGGRRAAWAAVADGRPALARASLALVLVLQAAAALLLAAVAVNLAVRRWPAVEPALRGRSVLAGHLLVGEPPAPEGDAVRTAMARQRQLAGGLGRLFGQGRDAVADATGMDEALAAIDALRELGALDPAGKVWLVRNHPPLARLVDHPGLRSLAGDPTVLDEVARVARGDLAAAWRLGDRPDVQALSGDAVIATALADLRLADLRRSWRARASEGWPVPVAWRLRVGPGACWAEAHEGTETFTGASDVPVVATTTLPADEAGRYRLLITGLDASRLWVAERTCALEATVAGATAVIAAAPASVLRLEAPPPVSGRFTLALSRMDPE